MGNMVNHNGNIVPSTALLVHASSRGLRYGDGLFDTGKVRDGQLELWPLHFKRLYAGLQTLHFSVPSDFTIDFLQREVLELVKRNDHDRLGRIRINVFRGEDQKLNYIIESFALEQDFSPIDAPALSLGIFPHGRKSIDAYSSLKSNNYLIYLMGAAWAKAEGWGECLILNPFERIADASIHNVFAVKGNTLLTPALTEGGIAGVMRRYLISQAPSWGWTIHEMPLSVLDVEEADEVFLTNALAGMRFVRQLGKVTYGREASRVIYQQLVQSLKG
jgi:branched-chain amino acid aminotransferase